MAYDLGIIGAGVKLDNKPFMRGINQMQTRTANVLTNMQGAFLRIFGTLGLIKLFKDATEASMEFGASLSNIISIADDLQINKVRKEILALNDVLGESTALANSFYRAYSAGARGSAKELAGFTGEVAKLSRAILADQVPTMKSVTKLMNSYGLTIKDVGEISDTLFQIVKQGDTTGQEIAGVMGLVANSAAVAGVSLDELGAALAVLTRTMETSRATISLNQVITSFLDPTKEAKEVAKELGIELNANTIKSIGFANAISLINEKAGDNVEALNLMFGNVRAFRAIASLAGNQAEAFQAILGEFGKKGGTALKAFEKQIDNTKTTWTSSLVSMNKAMIKFGDAMAPMIKNIAFIIKEVSKVVQNVSAFEIQLGLGAIALAYIAGKFRNFGMVASQNTVILGQQSQALAYSTQQTNTAAVANQGLTQALNANTLAATANMNAYQRRQIALAQSTLVVQNAARNNLKTMIEAKAVLKGTTKQAGYFKTQIDRLGGSMGVLHAAMLAVPVAMAGWRFGRWINETTGFDEKVSKFYGDLLHGREEIEQTGFLLDEAILGQKRGILVKRLNDIQKKLPQFADEWDEFRSRIRKLDPGDLAGLSQIEKEVNKARIELAKPFGFDIEDLIKGKGLKGALAETLLDFSPDMLEKFLLNFTPEALGSATPEDFLKILNSFEEYQQILSKNEAVEGFKDSLNEISLMTKKFEQDRLKARIEGARGGRGEQRKAMLEQFDTEKAFYLMQIRELYNQQAVLRAAGLTKESAKVTEELQKQLESYDKVKDNIKEIQDEIAANSPLAKLRREMESAGGLTALRDAIFKDGVTEQEKETFLKTAGPEGQARFTELLDIARGRGLAGKEAEDIALRTLNTELRKELKKGNLTEEKQLDLLGRIAEAIESGDAPILFTEK